MPAFATTADVASSVPESRHRPFVWPCRVYWEDTDAGGVVYHARYLHFLERARTEWLRARGHGQQQLREEDGSVFVVHRMELDFNAPARLDDLLVASVEVVESRSASFTVRQTLRREGEEKSCSMRACASPASTRRGSGRGRFPNT
jgi:acyl-CoA thioester hydrolase